MMFICTLHGDDGEDPHEIDAHNSRWAAEEFAEHLFNDHDGWEWMENRDLKVDVIPKSGGEMEQFVIEIRMEPGFYARKVVKP
ncbi:hypothetical protein [Tuwongella immobilis]|uniref:Uncharacterized protein n=1 Tax=Tuwongella immobilis TaxID=692036 RepID=A0A6C2YS46_9BACT|nr:hypothetical protein [Tuwongella immobilis]VIP03953.1 unnamed protein product [Tuwongella immobilis]VTS05273.1 unnamed protein product [Tuwongella immobilis]